MLNSKDLLATLPASVGPSFRVLIGRPKCGELSIDSAMVVGEVAEKNGRRLTQSKGLDNRSSPSDWAPF